MNDAVAIAVSELVQAERPPSHDQLDRLFARAGLADADPKTTGSTVGKLKRVRAVLTFAIDANPAAGARLVAALIDAVRAGGGFRPSSPTFIGVQALNDVQGAFRAEGYELDDDGLLRPALLDGLDEQALDDALGRYVRRARQGARDAALVTGTGKDLLEAVARHVLLRSSGSYDERMGFPGTLFHAFNVQGLATPPGGLLQACEAELDEDPRRRLEQTLYLLGVAVNKLRNAQGTGHGRPFPSSVSDAQAKAAVEAMGVISELLLTDR
ncbi:MAG: abortive infection family protein [Dehalococcoidia bacterium]